MSIADDIKLSAEADADLRAIGGLAEETLFNEIAAIPSLSEAQCRPLRWQPRRETLRRTDVGDYCVTVTIRTEADGTRIAMAERVVLQAELERWIAAEIERAEARG